MKYKTYKTYQTAVIVIVAMLVSWSVVAGYAVVPVITVIAGMVVLFILKKQVKEVIVDERAYSIYYKASSLAFRIGALLAAVTGGTLIALSRTGSPALEQAGFTLAYAAAAMVFIYYVAHIYYSRKMGGGE